MRIRAAFRRQAAACGKLGSVFTARLLEHLADCLEENSAVGGAILDWPGDPRADALALRTAGAFHALALTGQSADLVDVYPPKTCDDDQLMRAIETALAAHGEDILGFIQNPPQTNEVGRAAPLAGGFLTIASLTSLPLAMFEIGASAGLNLHWDQFRYDLGGLAAGKASALPLLAPAWQGPKPPSADLRIMERAGCDQAPIDIRSDDDALRLRAYIWPDQADRLERLDQALALARPSPLRVERADAADWVSSRLTERRQGVATVLFHSIVWQYIEKGGQERLERAIDAAGRRANVDAPFAWLRMEPETPKAAALRLTLWPGGQSLLLADVDYHGSWIRWHAEPGTFRPSSNV